MEQNNKTSFEKMQRDAEARLKEMQRRSSRYDLNADIPPVPNFVQVGNHHQNKTSTREKSSQNATDNAKTLKPENAFNKIRETSSNHSLKKGFDLLKLFNFSNFKLDNDILVIVVLILLLSSEEADELLLMALVYIML